MNDFAYLTHILLIMLCRRENVCVRVIETPGGTIWNFTQALGNRAYTPVHCLWNLLYNVHKLGKMYIRYASDFK